NVRLHLASPLNDGSHTLTVGPHITNEFDGREMDQNKNGIAGEAEDVFIIPIQAGFGNVLNVGPNKLFTTIQSAIDAADINDIILIDEGTYTENLVLNKLVHLKGNTIDPSLVEIRS